MTFEDEEAYNRALQMNEQVNAGLLPQQYSQLLGETLEILEAPEPTDIIWENKFNTD